MGRSVLSFSDATAVAYTTFGPDEEYYRELFAVEISDGLADEDDDFENWMYQRWNSGDAESEWENLKDWIKEHAQELWPSFEESEDYDHHSEQNVILYNTHSIISISEYCGAVAISLAPNYDREQYWMEDGEISGLSKHWREQIAEKFVQEFGTMHKIGTFSNGESVYQMEKSS